jgi:uncharacterized membrane protein YvlD (DUF360 family)
MKKFFFDLFKDNNDINEKAIVGFGAFILLVLVMIIDLITGLMGKEFPIHEFVFNGFLIMALGSFGIASVDKFINKKITHKNEEEEG